MDGYWNASVSRRGGPITLMGQRGGASGQAQRYGGIEPPPRWPDERGFNAANDPLGIGVQGRGMAARQEAEQEATAANPFRHIGPLPDPAWQGLFQAMQERGVDRVRGAETPGTNQLRGFSSQPDYLTTAPGLFGRPNQGYRSTLFAPGQESAVTGLNFGQDQAYQAALNGLKRYR